MFFVFKFLFGILVILILLGVGLTWQRETSKNQKIFLDGKAPSSRLDGFYNGSASGNFISWLGKKFDSLNNTGINVFDKDSGGKNEKYPFKTYYSKGIRDKNHEVFSIDYNLKENPFWLRIVLDEIVEVAPGEYLGKLHLRIIQNYPLTVAYFKLKKELN